MARPFQSVLCSVVVGILFLGFPPGGLPSLKAEVFEGQFFRGEGDKEYLQLLDISRRMFAADPEFQKPRHALSSGLEWVCGRTHLGRLVDPE